MNKDQTFDIVLTSEAYIDDDKVSADELRLISSFFPEILLEMMQHIEIDEE